jgi:hypothetical protein
VRVGRRLFQRGLPSGRRSGVPSVGLRGEFGLWRVGGLNLRARFRHICERILFCHLVHGSLALLSVSFRRLRVTSAARWKSRDPLPLNHSSWSSELQIGIRMSFDIGASTVSRQPSKNVVSLWPCLVCRVSDGMHLAIWRRGEYGWCSSSRRAIAAGWWPCAGGPLGVEEEDCLPSRRIEPRFGELGERLVDRLVRLADQLCKLLLPEVAPDAYRAAVVGAEAFGQPQKLFGYASGHVGGDQIGHGVVGARRRRASTRSNCCVISGDRRSRRAARCGPSTPPALR